jgi:2-amino-4-hydroxy-6-hydroxymethyldihydropteridine diphosphokinase
MATVILALGSNIGDRHSYLEKACDGLKTYVADFKPSRIIETNPLYVTDQPAFLNQVVMGVVDISVADLFHKTKELQQHIGRTKTYLNGPREIDIDILYYDDLILDTDDLTLPHPRIAERLFVLQPLFEIAPHWLCPRANKSVQMMRDELLKK